MWFSVVCTLIDNGARHHSGQNVVVRNKLSYITERALCFSYWVRQQHTPIGVAKTLPVCSIFFRFSKNPIIIAVFASNSIFSMTDYLNCDCKLNYGCILRNSIVSKKL